VVGGGGGVREVKGTVRVSMKKGLAGGIDRGALRRLTSGEGVKKKK